VSIKGLKANLNCDRLPTMKELINAIEHPETSEPWIREYIRLWPELEKRIKLIINSLLKLEEKIRKESNS